MYVLDICYLKLKPIYPSLQPLTSPSLYTSRAPNFSHHHRIAYPQLLTVIKKRPNSNPLYGAMSDSTCNANSVSARSKPARKAPKAIDNPACSKRKD